MLCCCPLQRTNQCAGDGKCRVSMDLWRIKRKLLYFLRGSVIKKLIIIIKKTPYIGAVFTCWLALKVVAFVAVRLLAKRAEKPNSRLKIFRPIRMMICATLPQNSTLWHKYIYINCTLKNNWIQRKRKKFSSFNLNNFLNCFHF